jgi:hypothetical protein
MELNRVMKSFDRGCVVVASAEAVSCDLGDGTALLDLKSNQYYTLNKVGSFVWTLIQSPKTCEEICEAMMARYDVPASRCAADLSTLLTSLEAACLVRLENEIPLSSDVEESSLPAMSDRGDGHAPRVEPVEI